MTKSKDEILLFLVRNSTPGSFLPVSQNEFGDGEEDENGELKKISSCSRNSKLNVLLLRLSGNVRFICELSKLEEFLGEELSFEKHLRGLYEEGTLLFSVAEKGSFYDSEDYRKAFDKTTGRIKDYKTEMSWVAFWYRENKFLDEFNKIVENAEELWLYDE